MKNVLKICSVLFFIFISAAVAAQDTQKKVKEPEPSYKTALGIKFYPTAISLKTMTGKKSAMEFLGYFKDGFRLTGLYEIHGMLSKKKNFKWYVGFGGHLGLGNQDNGNDAKLGADGVIGLDYKFLNLPLNLSLDWQPAFGIGDDKSFTNWGGIGVRFAF
jgi:hypothetical protein